MKKLLNCSCSAKWGDAAPLVLRVVTGLIFTLHGWQKLQGGVEGVTGMLVQIGFPMATVFALILIAVELIGGIALILGAFTHWSAKLLVVVAFVALVTVHLQNGFFAQNGGYEYILLILAATISLAITGAGKWSVDRMLWNR
ncbi:DoxX family protein [Patescibacteria group bacterium]|nr:DoxX family protein [Patescibacteria group bacterium]MBU1754865.1 DoxX family protein [Patescibacteria group bacterium]